MNANPLMSKIKLPGRTFQLPSRGALYKNGELSCTEGEIHVHPLSAIAEISLKNPDLLFNGKAIEAVFQECIPEIKKVSELYGRDIDAIMFFLRMVTYGPEFVITVTHSCADAKSHSYTVDLEKMIQEFKFLDPTVVENDYTVTLQNGQVVKIHPIKFEHMIKLFQMNANKKEFTQDDTKKNMIFNLTNIIESVDGETNKKFIEEWVAALTTPYQNRISKVIEKTNDWGPSKTTVLKCKDCGEDMTVELPIDPAAFFSE
jgi:hypothetical protein